MSGVSPANSPAGPSAGSPGGRCLRAARVGVVLVRLALGALFVFSGVSKLRDPELFGFALKALRLGVGDSILVATAFVVPWWEVVAGALLVAGCWVRAAGGVIVGLLTIFTASIVMLMVRGLAVDCPCFGAFELVCTGPLGPCHLVRNALLLAAAFVSAAGVALRGDLPKSAS